MRDAELFVAIDAREDRRGGVLEAQVNLASMVRLEWLEELFPAHLRRERLTRYDESRRRVISTTQLWYHDLLLREDVAPALEPRTAGAPSGRGPAPEARETFSETTRRPAQWLARVEFVRRALPELDWPDFDDEVLAELLDDVCQGKSRLEEIEQTDLVPFLQSRLTPAQSRELHESAPSAPSLPSGRPAGWPTNPAGRRSWPCGFRNCSAGPRPPRRPRPRAGLVAHPRPEQPARADHRRSEELLDDHLSPGAKRPPPPLSQTRLAGRPVSGSAASHPEAAQVIVRRVAWRCKPNSIAAQCAQPALPSIPRFT